MGNTATKKKGCCGFILSRLFKTKFPKLITAIRLGNLTSVRKFHKQGLNFNQYNENGDTPLHIAARYNRLEILKFICENVANITINDKNGAGDTPLLLAVMNSSLEMVQYLIEDMKADVDCFENKGYTPFIAAAARGDEEIIKYLYEVQGANIRLRTFDGQTALHRAAFYGNIDAIKYLISVKMNPLVPDRKGNLPLHCACMRLNITCARILIKASQKSVTENLNWKNKAGVCPMDYLSTLLNRLRDPAEDPEEITRMEIEEYIRDKSKVPHAKTELQSPGMKGQQSTINNITKTQTNTPNLLTMKTSKDKDSESGILKRGSTTKKSEFNSPAKVSVANIVEMVEPIYEATSPKPLLDENEEKSDDRPFERQEIKFFRSDQNLRKMRNTLIITQNEKKDQPNTKQQQQQQQQQPKYSRAPSIKEAPSPSYRSSSTMRSNSSEGTPGGTHTHQLSHKISKFANKD